MDWGKVIYVFFALMSLTTNASFIYDHNPINLYIAGTVNLISTVLKIGVRNILSAELLATSLVADLHLIPAFFLYHFGGDIEEAIALAIGALVANIVSTLLLLIEANKDDDIYKL